MHRHFQPIKIIVILFFVRSSPVGVDQKNLRRARDDFHPVTGAERSAVGFDRHEKRIVTRRDRVGNHERDRIDRIARLESLTREIVKHNAGIDKLDRGVIGTECHYRIGCGQPVVLQGEIETYRLPGFINIIAVFIIETRRRKRKIRLRPGNIHIRRHQ